MSVTWGSSTIAMANIGYIVGFVDGDPELHFVA